MSQATLVMFPSGLRLGMLLATAVLAVQPLLATADDVAKVHRERISSIGSERATSGNGNKIITFDAKTHVVWQDANREGYFARVRTLDHKTSKWSPTYAIGEGRDNHARTADRHRGQRGLPARHHRGASLGPAVPTQERPTGFNGVAAGQFPSLLYFEGLSRYRKPGEIIQNDVYFVQLD